MAWCSARTLMDGRCCHTRANTHTHAYTHTRTRQPSVQARVAAQPGKRPLGMAVGWRSFISIGLH